MVAAINCVDLIKSINDGLTIHLDEMHNNNVGTILHGRISLNELCVFCIILFFILLVISK
jgi:hypothetical protein